MKTEETLDGFIGFLPAKEDKETHEDWDVVGIHNPVVLGGRFVLHEDNSLTYTLKTSNDPAALGPKAGRVVERLTNFDYPPAMKGLFDLDILDTSDRLADDEKRDSKIDRKAAVEATRAKRRRDA